MCVPVFVLLSFIVGKFSVGADGVELTTLALCNFPFRSYPLEGFPGCKLAFYITKDLMKNVSCSFCQGCCNWRKL